MADPAMAVVVQQMIASEQSESRSLPTPARGSRIISSSRPLSAWVRLWCRERSSPTPMSSTKTLELLDVKVGCQAFKIERGPEGHDVIVELDPAEAEARALDDNSLRRVAELAIATEAHHGCPQDVEWAIASGKTWLVQARPITTLGNNASDESEKSGVLVRGLPAVPGSASGRVRVLHTPQESNRLLDNEILVAPMTNPDWLPAIRRAAALVTEIGGMTCHAAIVARELRVRCVVGARGATTVLPDGQTVTVDGARGNVSARLLAAPYRVVARRGAVPLFRATDHRLAPARHDHPKARATSLPAGVVSDSAAVVGAPVDATSSSAAITAGSTRRMA
jgi:pyruvate,water dikinase